MEMMDEELIKKLFIKAISLSAPVRALDVEFVIGKYRPPIADCTDSSDDSTTDDSTTDDDSSDDTDDTTGDSDASGSDVKKDLHTSWWRKIIKPVTKTKKQPVVFNKDLADCDLDEELLKQNYLKELRKRKRFPYFLTYKFGFLRRFRPKLDEEHKYSPMAIPDEIFERYFSGIKNPWDYPSSPLWLWTPPKI